jgi:hypothetical protein
MNTPSPELRDLLDRLIEHGGLSRPEMGSLEELMRDPAVMSYCCEILLHESLMPEALASMETAIGHVHGVAAAPRPTFLGRAIRVLPLAAAAGIAFFAGMLVGEKPASAPGLAALPPPPGSAASQGAKVTGMMGVVWDEDATPYFTDGSVQAQRVAFKSGLVELTYTSGVRVTLEGPADFTVSDPKSGRIANGKLVAYVPKGAEGFTVDYGNGQVVDLGTEFAMELAAGGKMELGVFDGEVELHLPGDSPLLLHRSQAMVHDRDAEEPLRPVPFNRNKFIRELPNRDFPWSIQSAEPLQLELDVSHLIWKSAEYRAIFKWISGKDAVEIRDVKLLRDGEVVAADARVGTTGVVLHVRENLFEVTVPPGSYRPGRWTLRATVTQLPRTGGMTRYRGPVDSHGIVLFEEGLVNRAQASDFIGRWGFNFAGARFVREFHADGTITVSKNGRRDPKAFANCSWWVDDGILHAEIPNGNGLVESHLLRDRNTLIFTNRAFDNASRLPPPGRGN